MNKLTILVLLMICTLASCKKKEPCDELVNGVYQFPELPKNHSMTSQEITEFRDLPQDICNCISTEGLIETCLKYPELRLIYAGSNPQAGYNLLVKDRFRGIRELETRPDRGAFLLKKYQTLDPLGYDPSWDPIEIGAFDFNIYNIEIIFSQYANLKPLTKKEQISLIETAVVIYHKHLSDPNNQSMFPLECVTALLGRLMYLNNFEEFVKLYNENSSVFELIEFYGPTAFETPELVIDLSEKYLNILKNQ